MTQVTRQQLDDFHQFATERLTKGSLALSWDELLIEWQSVRERATENAAIREALADVEAGRHEAASDAMEEIRAEFDFPA